LPLQLQQSEEAWVNFKLFGTMGLTFALIIITVIFISKYIKEEK
jgi:Intracellular septation protein A.